jgi:flagellin-specific chaperone FliS
MQPSQAYRRNAQSAWTRVEMLLAIYDALIQHLDDGIDMLNRQDLSAYPQKQLKVSQLILLLLDGVDTRSGELAEHVRDLCIHALGQISEPVTSHWEHVRELMQTLREGFQGIRAEANLLESTGEIRPLHHATSHTMLHA